MTRHVLLCHSGTAFLFDLQFCSFIPETGTCQLDNSAGYQSRRCLVEWPTRPDMADLYFQYMYELETCATEFCFEVVYLGMSLLRSARNPPKTKLTQT